MKAEKLIHEAGDLHIKTERLIIRRLAHEDYATAVRHEQDPEIMRWIRGPLPAEEIERRVRQSIDPWQGETGQWLLLAIQPKTTNQMIGIAACRLTDLEAETVEIGYRLQPDMQRQGLGFEVCKGLLDHLFLEIETRKVLAYCATENEASWRLMEKLGMQREATMREHSFLQDAYRDEYCYGILRREWSA
jgi:[ribosomal protein S5]-alanine N-acetyltransferase